MVRVNCPKWWWGWFLRWWVGVFHAKRVSLFLAWKGGASDVLGVLPGCPGPLGVFKKFVQKKSSGAFAVPFFHPAAKGVRQKESGKKVTKKVTEASEKVTKKWPKESRKRKNLKWSNSFCRPPFAAPWFLICQRIRWTFRIFFIFFCSGRGGGRESPRHREGGVHFPYWKS